jgi:DNA-binding MarR family transcriptional regulator
MSASELTQLVLDWSMEFTRSSMQDINRCARNNGLSFPLMNVLMHLYFQGPREVMKFAEYMQVSPAGASQMVERLVQEDLVVRRGFPKDRRVRRVCLTDRGRALVEESLAAQKQWVHALVESLSADQQAAIASALRLLLDQLASTPSSVG